jgi:hypothetical protein
VPIIILIIKHTNIIPTFISPDVELCNIGVQANKKIVLVPRKSDSIIPTLNTSLFFNSLKASPYDLAMCPFPSSLGLFSSHKK